MFYIIFQYLKYQQASTFRLPNKDLFITQFYLSYVVYVFKGTETKYLACNIVTKNRY